MERSLVPRRITLSEELRKVMSAPVRGAWAIAHIHGRRIKPARYPFGCPEDKHRDARFWSPDIDTGVAVRLRMGVGVLNSMTRGG